MNWPGDTSSSSCRERSAHRSSSGLPPPFVTKMYGLDKENSQLAEAAEGIVKLICRGEKGGGAEVETKRQDSHLNAIRIFTVDVPHRLDGSWNRVPTSNKHTVNIKRESKFVCSCNRRFLGWSCHSC